MSKHKKLIRFDGGVEAAVASGGIFTGGGATDAPVVGSGSPPPEEEDPVMAAVTVGHDSHPVSNGSGTPSGGGSSSILGGVYTKTPASGYSEQPIAVEAGTSSDASSSSQQEAGDTWTIFGFSGKKLNWLIALAVSAVLLAIIISNK